MAARSIEAWARSALVHPPGASPWPGPWRPRHPAYRDVLRAASTEKWRRLVVSGSTQSGKTELLAILASFYAVTQHAPVLVYSGSLALRVSLAKRLREMYACSSLLPLAEAFEKKRPPFQRDLPGGGSIVIVASTEATAFQSRSARVVLLDEVRSHRHSLVLAAEGRQSAWAKKDPKTVLLSSAAPRPPCRITEALERSDSRVWKATTPCCGRTIPIDWSLVDGYGDDPQHAYLKCPLCEFRMDNAEAKAMIGKGWFDATRDAQDTGTIGFHISEILNPDVPLSETARKHASALRAFKNTGSSAELRDFHADALAQVYRDNDTSVDPELARQRCRAAYNPDVYLPAGVSALTCAVDVQVDRLELEVVGWGALEVAAESSTKLNLDRRAGWTSWKVGERYFRLLRWGVMYLTIPGDPNTDGPWEALNKIRMRSWRIGSATGPELRIGLTLCDSGGMHTEKVRAWSRSTDHTAAACKGSSRPGQPISRPAVTSSILNEYAKPLIFVGGDTCKDIILGSVRRSTLTVDGSWTWPDNELHGYDWRFFTGLLASEQRVMVESRLTGFAVSRYIKNPSVANEPLDLACYGLAALSILGLPTLISNSARLRLVKGAA